MLTRYGTELKNRILLITGSWVLSILISYFYRETLLFFSTKFLIVDSLYFIATDITEILTSYLYLSYFTGTLFTVVFGFYHLLVFLSPSLYYSEFFSLKVLILTLSISLILSILIFNGYIIPYLWHFFLNFQVSNSTVNLYFEGKLNEYVEFYLKVYTLYFLVSQLLIFVFVCSSKSTDIVKQVKRYRKIIYVFFVLIATVFTPPDILSQVSVFLFSQILYEFLILILIFIKFVNLGAN